MDIYVQALVMGIVQGLTEFLPISSSGHLLLVPYLVGWDDPFITSLAFSVVLHAGTLAALLVYENTWAIPFVAAAREAGGELVAGARIPAQDVMDALDALEAADTHDVTI